MKLIAIILFFISGMFFHLSGDHTKIITTDQLENDIFYESNGIFPFSGKCILQYPDTKETKMIMNFKEGKIHGVVISYYPNGNIKQKGNYLEGKLNGKWEAWCENGIKKYTANYLNDTLCGECTEYDMDGSEKKSANL